MAILTLFLSMLLAEAPHGSSDLEIDQQAYIERFCEVMEPPDTHVHHNDTSDEFERQIGEIEEIEHKIDLENL